MDDERLFDDDMTAEEAAELKARSQPATIVHSMDDYEKALASALSRAAASWKTAALHIASGASQNGGSDLEAPEIAVTITSSSVGEQSIAQA